MTWCIYTREILSEAVEASVSMAGVLRHLNLSQNGGAHAHLRRRIDALGIDTSHFLGRGHRRGIPHPARRAPDAVLVLRSTDRGRAAPQSLRRALVAQGRDYRCEACGIEGLWNGKRLNLHVDHIDGRFWDCRAENLRFLCPNCHSQTATYAGRNRRPSSVRVAHVDHRGNEIDDEGLVVTDRDDWPSVLARIERGEIGVTAAARLIGCHRNHVYRLRARLAEHGSLTPPMPRTRTPTSHQKAVVEFALAHPTLGPKKLSWALRHRDVDPITISHGTVSTILNAAGLATIAARQAASSGYSPPESSV
jgi:predicted RNA-binding Zn-ribbon protein involved in translation (DUF1610 family)